MGLFKSGSEESSSLNDMGNDLLHVLPWPHDEGTIQSLQYAPSLFYRGHLYEEHSLRALLVLFLSDGYCGYLTLSL